MSYNKFIGIGRLLANPEVRTMQNGEPVASFRLAIPFGEKSSDYISVIAYDSKREALTNKVGQNLKKDSMVYVEGYIQTRSWKDKNGNDQKTTEIVASLIKKLGEEKTSDEFVGINKAIIVGRLGNDPMLNQTNTSGKSVANFSIATSFGQKTEWHNCVAWENLADTASKHLAKGREVQVEGRLVTRKYEKDGVVKYTTELVVNGINFVGSKPENSDVSGIPGDDQIPY